MRRVVIGFMFFLLGCSSGVSDPPAPSSAEPSASNRQPSSVSLDEIRKEYERVSSSAGNAIDLAGAAVSAINDDLDVGPRNKLESSILNDCDRGIALHTSTTLPIIARAISALESSPPRESNDWWLNRSRWQNEEGYTYYAIARGHASKALVHRMAGRKANARQSLESATVAMERIPNALLLDSSSMLRLKENIESLSRD